MIKVGDICSELYDPVDLQDARSTDQICEDWAIGCLERNLNPMDQIALVLKDGKTEGWCSLDLIEPSKTLFECREPIMPDQIISSEMPIIDTLRMWSPDAPWFYFVIRGHQISGVLTYQDLYKLPVRLCLFSLLLNLESVALQVTQLSPQHSFSLLPPGRIENARKVYALRGYRRETENENFLKLLECTTFIDKVTMLRRNKAFIDAVPSLATGFPRSAERLRNSLAHPGSERDQFNGLSREQLLPFVEWAESCEQELLSLLDTDGTTRS